MTTNVPAITWNSTGIVVPTDAAILAGRQADFDTAYGVTLNHSLETPQGQLASSDSAIISDAYSQWAYLVNGLNPSTSTGVLQDGILSLYNLTRLPALATTVQCECIGLPGTVIDTNQKITDGKNIYQPSNNATIDSTGSITVQFVNQLLGAIPCPANSLTRIYQQKAGWDSVNNPTAGILGRDVESPQEAESRRKLSVQLNAQGTTGSIYGALLQLSGVIDAYVIDNTRSVTVLQGSTSYPLLANSIYCCIAGGADADIANIIRIKKGAGCSYNGNITYVTYDRDSYAYPYPPYPIQFQRPTPVPILFNIVIAQNSAIVSNFIALIQAAVISAFAGNDGGERARIGGIVYAIRFAGAILAVDKNIEIISINIGTYVANQSRIHVGIDQIPTIVAGNIQVIMQ